MGVYEVKHTGKQNGGYITDEKITGIVDACGSNSVLDRLRRNFRHNLRERLGRNRANQHYPCRIGEYHSETPEITDYLISGQLGEPGDSITTIETANFYYTIFIPTLDPDLSVAIDQADSFYLCLYEEGKLYDSPFCALVIYSKPITLSCMPSTGGKLNILITNGIIVSSHSVKQGDTVFNSTGISAISEANGRNVILSDDTLVEFSDSTFVLSQEKVDILIDTINLNF